MRSTWPKKRGGYVKYEYGDGEYCHTKAVKMWEHPNQTFLKQQESLRHVEAMKKQQKCKRMLTKDNIYPQMDNRQHVQKATIKGQNRCILTEFYKTIYFVVKKNWAVEENMKAS